MIYVSAFLCCGLLCAAAQLLYDNTKLTPGHITSIFVVLGALLESFDLYDRMIKICGMGANLPITSFGHSLAHASYAGALEKGWLGIFSNVFDKSSSGIAFAIFMAFLVAIIFRPKA